MLRVTETEETISSFVTFYHSRHFSCRGAGPLATFMTETVLEELKMYGWAGRYADRIEKAQTFYCPQGSVTPAASELFF